MADAFTSTPATLRAAFDDEIDLDTVVCRGNEGTRGNRRTVGPFTLPFVYMMMYISGMSQRYSIAEARSHLPRIVDEAEAGRKVELTRRGKPVAVVVSLRELERLRSKRAKFGEAYAAFLEEHALNEVGVEEGFAASVRDRSRGRETAL